MNSAFLQVLLYSLIILRWAKNIVLVLLLASFFCQFLATEKLPVLHTMESTVNAIIGLVSHPLKKIVPTVYMGVEFSQLILALLLQLLLGHNPVLEKKLRKTIRIKNAASNAPRIKYPEFISVKTQTPAHNTDFDAGDLKVEQPGDRKKMLRQFATLKSKLDEMGHDRAFLAIDVVDSTGMKLDEDKHIAAFAFERYNELVNETLRENGVVKFATTPDGVMSCFRTVDDAVNAASNLLKKLVTFNKEQNSIKRDFQIRCGINSGFIYLDDDTPLEQVSDRIIDIAGHMQKYAKPNTINIAASAIEPLKNSSGFTETTDVIDGQQVYQWAKMRSDINE